MELKPSILSTQVLSNIEDPIGLFETLSIKERKKKINCFADFKKLEISNIKVSKTVPTLDSIANEIYEDILFCIKHNLNHVTSSKKLNDNQQDEVDQPPIEMKSALSYVRDAFEIDRLKHVESFKRISLKPAPETHVNESSKANKISWPKVKNVEYIEHHSVLLQILLIHELKTSNIPPFYWPGTFNFLPSKILFLHAEFRYIDEPYISFAKWTACSEIHQLYPLGLQVFNEILDNIVDPFTEESVVIQSPKLPFLSVCLGFNGNTSNVVAEKETKKCCRDQLKTNYDEVEVTFWKSTNKLQEVFLNFIHNLHYKSDKVENFIKTVVLKNIFEIVERIGKIARPRDIIEQNFVDLMTKSLIDGTIEHFMENVRLEIINQSDNNDERLKELIRVIQFVQEHLKEFVDTFGEVFLTINDTKLAELLYKIYDSQLASLVKPIVLEIASTNEGSIDKFAGKDEEAIASELFNLYRELKKFSDYGMEAYGNYEYETKDYFNWFSAGIDKWCKVSVFSVMARIEKSIELDSLKPELKDVKYSSSAIDTIQILYSVKIFWEKLQWPDAVKEAEIIFGIAADLCRFATIYYDKFVAKVMTTEAMNKQDYFKVPLELAVAFANFSYISDEMQILIVGLTKDKVTDTSSIQKLMSNTFKYLTDKTDEFLDSTIKKCKPMIKQFMLEGAMDSTATDGNIANKLMVYIDTNLGDLYDYLPKRKFEVAKSILWQIIHEILSDFIQNSTVEKRMPEFFTNLQRIFKILKYLFKYSGEFTDDAARTKKIDYLLDCNSLSISRLIHQYYKDRYEMQQQKSKTSFNPFGVLTVVCHFVDNVLHIQILNARHLVTSESNKKCNSFVKIDIVPDKYFPNCQNFKTQVHNNTQFPLYDETFEFTLTDEQRAMNDAIIYFKIKEKFRIGSNECLAEAFLSFSDVPELDSTDKVKQMHLTLTRLQSVDLESLKAIRHRSQMNDKKAKEFLSNLRSTAFLIPKKTKIPVTQL